ncbi:MAG: sugar ABC transporter substrate-binding protein [Litorilinea sp.]|nr:MAG: sugar ABC transporter substrate-binding protein [Litorilinea sp.]
MPRRFHLVPFCVLLFSLLLAACQVPAQPPSAPEPGGQEEAAVASERGEPKYHFVMVSHIGAADPNMLWLTYAIAEFERRFPEVTVDYVATDQFSVEEMVSLTRQTVATRPDGIAIPIVSEEALGPILQEAIGQGIPVVAVNTIPPGEKTIPYLTYVGGDLYQDGVVLARAILDAAEAGDIPAPTGAVCANPDIGHQGLVARCNGFNDTMAAAGIASEMLDISSDPARQTSIIQSYLQGHPEVNAIFSTTARTGPVIYAAAKELGLSPDVDDAGVTIVSTDESPVSLEGVKGGHILATHSQGFYLQGFLPFQLLYYYLELGFEPTTDLLSGPILIDSSNVDKWIPLTRNAFGDQYDVLAQGAWE